MYILHFSAWKINIKIFKCIFFVVLTPFHRWSRNFAININSFGNNRCTFGFHWPWSFYNTVGFGVISWCLEAVHLPLLTLYQSHSRDCPRVAFPILAMTWADRLNFRIRIWTNSASDVFFILMQHHMFYIFNRNMFRVFFIS